MLSDSDEPDVKRSKFQEEEDDDIFKIKQKEPQKVVKSSETPCDLDSVDKHVFKVSASALPVPQIITYLRKAEDGEFSNRLICNPPIKPKAGSVYLYKQQSKDDKRYLDDQYFGFRDNGRKKIDVVTKIYYQMQVFATDAPKRKSVNFKKYIYFLTESTQSQNAVVMIHYTGDEKVYVHQPHGNSTKNRPYTKTSSETKEKIKLLVKDLSCAPKKVYEKLVRDPFLEEKTSSTAADYEAIDTPRDLEQIKNFKKSNSRKLKISKCEIFSIYELAKSDLANFVLKMELVPYDVIIVAEPVTLEIANTLLKVSNKDNSLPQLLSYDTTFELADSYVSVLVMRNVFLHGNPIFPVAMMIHDRKLKQVHETFWNTLSKVLELSVLEKRVPICCDREAAISLGIKNAIPNTNLLSCTNHIKRDVRFWLKANGGNTSDDITVISKQISLLLNSENPTEYSQLFEAFKEKWSAGFLQYFESSIQKDLITSSRYNCQQFAAFLDCLPTNNISESLNFLIKSHTNWKELPLDSLVLKFIEMQCCNLSEFARASKNLGKYRVKEGYRNLTNWKPPHYMHYSDSEFAKSVKASATPDEYLKPDQEQSKEIMAKRCLELKLVSHIAEQKMFVVRSPYLPDKFYNVTRNPNQKSNKREFICSCNRTGPCYHIVAVQMSLGDEVCEESTVYKLSTVKKKARNFKGRLGRKTPNIQDLTANVEGADDAAINNDKNSAKSSQNDFPLFTGTNFGKLNADMIDNEAKGSTLSSKLDMEFPTDSTKLSNESAPANKSESLCPSQLNIANDNEEFEETILKEVMCGPKITGQHFKMYPSLKLEMWIEGSIIDRVVISLLSKLKASNVLYIEEYIYQTVWKNTSPTHIASYAHERDGMNKDVVLVTVSNGNHWMLGVILLRAKTICLFDSKQFCTEIKFRLGSFECLLKILQVMLVSAGVDYVREDWKLVYASDAPRQLDGTECGVIVCFMVYSLVTGLPFPTLSTLSDQNHLRNRKWIIGILEGNSATNTGTERLRLPPAIKKAIPKTFVGGRVKEKDIEVGLCRTQVSNALLDDGSWTVCNVGKCLRDKEHVDKQVLCIACRNWFHVSCLSVVLQKLPSYFVCNACAPI